MGEEEKHETYSTDGGIGGVVSEDETKFPANFSTDRKLGAIMTDFPFV